MRIITWNMQGGTDGTESKWTKGVQALLNTSQGDADVVCLQESGAPSGNVVDLPDLSWTGSPPSTMVYAYFKWTPIKDSYYVLWVNTDTSGSDGRVNLALASQTAPTGFLYADPGLVGGRPAIGLITDDNVFSIHAFSGGGGDSDGLIKNVNAMGLPSWEVAGDYNREPSSWVPSYGVLCPPDKNTRPASKKKLDYMVKSAGAEQKGIVLDNFIVSDHYPVVYDV